MCTESARDVRPAPTRRILRAGLRWLEPEANRYFACQPQTPPFGRRNVASVPPSSLPCRVTSSAETPKSGQKLIDEFLEATILASGVLADLVKVAMLEPLMDTRLEGHNHSKAAAFREGVCASLAPAVDPYPHP
jgi:hypothetical protein